MKINQSNWLLPIAVFSMLACDKGTFLGQKPNSNIVIPTRLEELRGLLDDEAKVIETPLLGIKSSDEYYWTADAWQAASAIDRAAYVWANDVFEQDANTPVADWNRIWHQVFIANVVLDGLATFHAPGQQSAAYLDLKGAALFTRAKALFSLAEVFCPPYDAATSATDLGLPIRKSASISVVGQRASLGDTYTALLTDLVEAAGLLQATTLLPNRIRPTKVAAYALLARVTLAQRDYTTAGAYADTALRYHDALLDFNTISDHFGIDHPEAIYQNRTTNEIPFSTSSGVMHVDSVLYDLYADNDLRKTLFYKSVNGRITIKRTYSGTFYPFTGLAVDELYLIRAECNARSGKLAEAAADINGLLEKRYLAGTYVPVTFEDGQAALELVLRERRKELAFRGARWSDVRRLNKAGAGITMRRELDGKPYAIAPDDPRYALFIPQYEIRISGLKQNVRQQ